VRPKDDVPPGALTETQGMIIVMLARPTALEELLPDDFSKTLLAGGLAVLGSDNPIRAHLFAAALREAVGHLLHSLAPDEDLIQAIWFKKEADRPTRRQRMTYSIQGGIADEMVERLGIDATNMHRDAGRVIAELNKRTHVRPNTLLTDSEEIDAFARDVVDAVIDFLHAIRDMRGAVAEAVVHNASMPVFASFVQESNDMIDLLSTHSFVEQVDVTEVRVLGIGLCEIEYEAEGIVYVELNYGSGSDRARGEGATMRDEYPFKCRMTGAVSDLSDIHDVSEMEVDTSSFYE
jgi:hypothetical protein